MGKWRRDRGDFGQVRRHDAPISFDQARDKATPRTGTTMMIEQNTNAPSTTNLRAARACLPRARALASLAVVAMLTAGAAIGFTSLGSDTPIAQAQEAAAAATPAADAATATTAAADMAAATDTTTDAAAGAESDAATTTAAATAFTSDAVVVTASDGLNFRGAPALSGEIAAVLPAGLQATVVGGPVTANDYTWYQLDVNGVTGWSAGAYLASADTMLAYAAQIPSVALFPVGTAVQVADGPLNFRTAAGLSAMIQTELAAGATATIVAGPIAADGYTWYQIDINGTTGWSAGEYLATATAASSAAETTDATVTGS